MPVLDRQVPRVPVVPPSQVGLPPRSVPETRPTPLQKHYISLSAPAVVLGAVAITALNAGAAPDSLLVKACVLVAAPLKNRDARFDTGIRKPSFGGTFHDRDDLEVLEHPPL